MPADLASLAQFDRRRYNTVVERGIAYINTTDLELTRLRLLLCEVCEVFCDFQIPLKRLDK